MITYETNYLAHHGILGMKWGVRRYQRKDGTRTPLGKKREQKAFSKSKIVQKGMYGRLHKKNGELKSRKRVIADTIPGVVAGAGVTAHGVYIFNKYGNKKLAAIYGAVGTGLTIVNGVIAGLTIKERSRIKD